MGHRLHAIGAEFELHYSAKSRDRAGFLDDLERAAWRDRVHLHLSEDGSRADLDSILASYETGWHVYACGPDRYMSAVMAAAESHGFPEEARHLEYFSTPELPDYENHPFTLRLVRTGTDIAVPADESAADVLRERGFPIDLKCEDGLCGVCHCRLVGGKVEHRDFVLSKRQRETTIILCQSRAAEPGGIVEIDL